MDEEFIKNLELMRFKATGDYGTMKGRLEDVEFIAVEHPLKGLCLMATYSTKRTVGQTTGFIHKNKISVQEIAKLMIKLYEQLKGKKDTTIKETKNTSNSNATKYRKDNDYYSYKTAKYECNNCGWKGLGEDLEQGDMYDYGVEIHCPECKERIPGLIVFPTAEEMMEKGTEEDKIIASYNINFRKKWEESKLKDVSQLPDLHDNFIAFVLKEIEEEKENYILITHESKVIWKEIRTYEYYWRFIEIGKILKQKYGDKMIDLVPDVDGYCLYGDKLISLGEVENFRKKLRSHLN